MSVHYNLSLWAENKLCFRFIREYTWMLFEIGKKALPYWSHLKKQKGNNIGGISRLVELCTTFIHH